MILEILNENRFINRGTEIMFPISRLSYYCVLISALSFGFLTAVPILADEVSYEIDGKQLKESGTVKFQDDFFLILETPAGFWRKIPKKSITVQIPKAAPKFDTPDVMLACLTEHVKADPKLVKTRIAPDCIVALVLESPLPAANEADVEQLLKKTAATYAQAVKGVELFAKKQKLIQRKPAYPALICIFESDAQSLPLSGPGTEKLQNIQELKGAGGYDPVSNAAYICLDRALAYESMSKDMLIWQQFFHTGILKRGAPIPGWFLLGLAAGFERTDSKVEPNHLNLDPFSFQQLINTSIYQFEDIVVGQLDLMEHDQYLHMTVRSSAWGLHWFLLNKNRTAYTRYWKTMVDASPLQPYSDLKTMSDFKKAFGKDAKDFTSLFDKVLQATLDNSPFEPGPSLADFPIRKDRYAYFRLDTTKQPDNLPDLKIGAKLTNLSPFRTRTFYVGYRTSWQRYGSWLVDKLDPGETVQLAPEALKDIPGSKANNKGKHTVEYPFCYSTPSDGAVAEKWRTGELPPPE